MTKPKIIITLCSILLIFILCIVEIRHFQNDKKQERAESAESVRQTNMQEESEKAAFQSQAKDEVFVLETTNADFLTKDAETLYEEEFNADREDTEYVSYYIEDGILYLDEYADTGSLDEEGLAIYEWNRRQKIAEQVIYVDYNPYTYGTNALYITEDHILHGTGDYADVSLEDVKYARTYAGQTIALKNDGSVWCLGILYSLSDGRSLEYDSWHFIMPDAVYASLGHNLYTVITKDGSLYMWGDNSLGQFGDGSLLDTDSGFIPENYFYTEPVKVADHIKMVWFDAAGEKFDVKDGGNYARTYMLTESNDLFVCGEEIGDESRSFEYFGELGEDADGLTISCTGRLYPVEVKIAK